MNNIITSTERDEKFEALTSAVLLMARSLGTRLTTGQMCERLGITPRTLRQWVKIGKYPKPHFDMYLVADYLKWQLQQIPLATEDSTVDTGLTQDRGFHLYRHFDAAGVLLYVGVSISALNRLGAHKQNAHWFWRIAKVEVANYTTREQSLMAERIAIRNEKPLFNIIYNLARAA